MDEFKVNQMRKIEFPNIGSIIIVINYFVIMRFNFMADKLDAKCIRLAHEQYSNGVGFPVFLTSLIASFYIIYIYRKNVKNRFIDYILVSPIVFHFVFFLINSARNFFL